MAAFKTHRNRYEHLTYNKDQDPFAYAEFLKSQERICNPDGYIDSHKFKHPSPIKKQRNTKMPKISAVDISIKKDEIEENYTSHVKAIEDHMWKAKQEERELKRFEGDIIKNQREVQRVLRLCEQDVEKKLFEEDVKLNIGLEKYTDYQRQYARKKQTISNERTLEALNLSENFKDLDRKYQLNTLGIARQYRAKMDELELRRHEADVMLRDFEAKFHRKEEEQNELKRCLAQLANAMSMEVMRGKQQIISRNKNHKEAQEKKMNEDNANEKDIEFKLATSGGEAKDADATKRRLTADLQNKQSRIAITKREEDRALQSTRFRLSENAHLQQGMNEDAQFAAQELRRKRFANKIDMANKRKEMSAQSEQNRKSELHRSQEDFFAKRAAQRQKEWERRVHEDSQRHFALSTGRSEQKEMELIGQLKLAEQECVQEEQLVRKFNQMLTSCKHQNYEDQSRQLRENNMKEEELRQELLRHQAQLDKVLSRREETYYKLRQHRGILDNDRYNYKEFSREHDRMIEIGKNSDELLLNS